MILVLGQVVQPKLLNCAGGNVNSLVSGAMWDLHVTSDSLTSRGGLG